LKKELIKKLEEAKQFEITINNLTMELADVKNKLCLASKDRDALSEEKKKILSNYKSELAKLQEGISTKSSEDDKLFKTLHSEKMELTSKLDSTNFRLNECENELAQKK